MRISIFGLGYVGAVSLACLARDGHHLVGVDVSQDKLDLIASGRSPVIEEGIQELMQQVVASGRVEVTKDVEHAIASTDLSFVCVGTPSSPRGSQDLSAVLRVAESIGRALKAKPGFHTVVVRSTVEPGTVEGKFRPVVEQHSGKRSAVDFSMAFQPEFLREGTSIADYDKPPFTICGAAMLVVMRKRGCTSRRTRASASPVSSRPSNVMALEPSGHPLPTAGGAPSGPCRWRSKHGVSAPEGRESTRWAALAGARSNARGRRIGRSREVIAGAAPVEVAPEVPCHRLEGPFQAS